MDGNLTVIKLTWLNCHGDKNECTKDNTFECFRLQNFAERVS